MIWYGQYNAILVLSLIAAIILSVVTGAWEIGFLTFFLVIVLRICATFLNLLFSAFTGFPLIYDTKVQLQQSKARATE